MKKIVILLMTLFWTLVAFAHPFQNANQKAMSQFSEEHYEQAESLFQDDKWRAAALYRQGKFKESVDVLKDLNDPVSHFNRGNALAKAKQFEEAVKAYEQALKLDRNFVQAKDNKEKVQSLMDNDENDQKSNNSEESKQDNSQDTGSSKNNSMVSGQEGEQQSSERQDDTNDDESSNEADNNNSDQQAQSDAESKETQQEDEATSKPVNSEQSDTGSQDDSDVETEQWLRKIPDYSNSWVKQKILREHKKRHTASGV